MTHDDLKEAVADIMARLAEARKAADEAEFQCDINEPNFDFARSLAAMIDKLETRVLDKVQQQFKSGFGEVSKMAIGRIRVEKYAIFKGTEKMGAVSTRQAAMDEVRRLNAKDPAKPYHMIVMGTF